jgi:type II restriction/modification system DNA methylase subunit YeeA
LLPNLNVAQLAPECGTSGPKSLAQLKPKRVAQLAPNYPPNHFDFFGPWYGKEKTAYRDENEADVKAADRMARIYDLIRKDNPRDDENFLHDLNVFLSRLLFCYFAEDTQIFHPDKENLFSNGLASNTEKNGSDTQNYLTSLFINLNTPKADRDPSDPRFRDFPFVNGGLFRHKIDVPVFTTRSRRAIIEAGGLDWKAINPDIFGSMIQAVVDKEKRGGLGMHYTSVPNIMKIVEPLFLNDLYAAFEKASGSRKKLADLQERISKIKIFDPACGSGNFLIIAYKELRTLEMKIIRRQEELGAGAGAKLDFGANHLSKLSLDQFYGIEIDDFAHEIAILALWLTEHQINTAFRAEFGTAKPTLPLSESGQITYANACRHDWEVACPKEEGDETYILGNPPFLGSRNQSKEQKKDVRSVFPGLKEVNSLDYVSCWFMKGAMYNYMNSSKCAFISTNSVCQGDHVAALWPSIFKKKSNIFFAHTSFFWENNAKKKAAVYVVAIGLAYDCKGLEKKIYTGGDVTRVSNISPYLTDYKNLIIWKRSKPHDDRPSLVYGNQAIEGGHLIFSRQEKNTLVTEYPDVTKYIRPLYGAEDYMNDEPRYCLWIDKESVLDARRIECILR